MEQKNMEQKNMEANIQKSLVKILAAERPVRVQRNTNRRSLDRRHRKLIRRATYKLSRYVDHYCGECQHDLTGLLDHYCPCSHDEARRSDHCCPCGHFVGKGDDHWCPCPHTLGTGYISEDLLIELDAAARKRVGPQLAEDAIETENVELNYNDS